MNITLKRLEIKNFKGIKNLKIEFDSHTTIKGDNGLGKSCVFDAYCWLLWDKDSENKKDFKIKPFDEKGEVIHNLESSVTGELLIDNKSLKIQKIYKEVWTKKRGKTTEEFTGHTTEYYINDVPVKKKEYNDRISTVLSEDNFNLLSNTLYFNSILDNNKRRSVLLSLIDDVGYKDVIEVNEDLKELDLENYSVDEIKAMAKASAKKINKNLESIPARIDELINSKVDKDFDTIEFNVRSTKPALEDIDRQLADVSKSADKISEINKEILELEKEKNKIIFDVDLENESNKKDFEFKRSMAEKERQSKLENIKNLENVIEENIFLKREFLKKINALKIEWKKERLKKYDGDLNCPYCKRPLEEHQVDDILHKFNLNKSKNLEKIENDANNLKVKISEFEERNISKSNEIEVLKKELENLSLDIKSREKIEYPKDKIDKLDENIKSKKEELKNLSDEDKTYLLDKKKELTQELESLNSILALKGQNEKIDKRIEELKSQEKNLAMLYEEQQRIINLCEEYVRNYVDLVSSKINAKFKYTKFKLLETQINGGIIETCEATYNGVPYSSLNTAARINVGLDVINTLAKAKGLYIPIFVDNAESINKLNKVDSQIVRLKVSDDEELLVC